MPEFVSLLPLIGIALLFWLFIIRPASRRQRDTARLQSALGVGDEIVLTSGIYGTVRRVEDGHVLLEIADGVSVKVARGAVGAIATPAEERDGNEQDHDDQPGVSDGPEEN